MISIGLSNITLILGAKRIFTKLNWEIQHEQKIGLIGPNGAGKSSLLKIIAGEISPEPGGSVVARQGGIGGLPGSVTGPGSGSNRSVSSHGG